VIAVIAALALAAAGGYGGYWYVLSRPVKVSGTNHLSVEVPRAWSQKAANDTGLLVSTNTANWSTNAGVAGVFVGLRDGQTLPTSTTPPPGCQPAQPDSPPTTGTTAVTFQYTCSGPPVTERFTQLDNGKQLWVQVRDTSYKTRAGVADSAEYTP